MLPGHIARVGPQPSMLRFAVVHGGVKLVKESVPQLLVIHQVELAPGVSATAEELIQYCKERIGSMKSPKRIEIVEALPRSAVGKVLKREVREKYWGGNKRMVN